MLIDISPEVSTAIAVFPGDTRFQRETMVHFEGQAQYSVSRLVTTPHIGAHVDAPSHYHQQGKPIDEVSLDPYFGPAQVIEVSLKPGERIFPKDLKSQTLLAPRILFKTNSYLNPNEWKDDFNALSPDLIEFLAQKKVVLVGIDTPSVDLAQDQVLKTHLKLYETGMANLEGICLKSVLPGLYTLIALPLKIKGCDASPVRAVLVKD